MLEIGGPNTPLLRQPNPRDQPRERLLKAMFLLWCRTKCKSTIPGRADVKPGTLSGHLYAVKRVHEANGLEFLTRGQSSQVINSLTREYELIHGPEALMPQKREGFTPGMVRMLLRAVDGLKLGTRKHPEIFRGSWLAYNIKGAISLSGNAGFRQSEVTTMEHSEFTAMQMSRASLFFIIQGKVRRSPSRAELTSMVEGDKVGILAACAKNDQWASNFMPFPVIMGIHPMEPDDPHLRDLALYCPIPADQLRRTPLFTMSSAGVPLGYNFLTQVLKALLAVVIPPNLAAQYTWHSFRVGLACALRAAQAPDWVLLALIRWRSPSSIPGYGRVSFDSAASWLDQAAMQESTSIQSTHLPAVNIEPNASTVPNLLSEEAYSYLDRVQTQDLDTSSLSTIQASLPSYDDYQFMIELSGHSNSTSRNDNV